MDRNADKVARAARMAEAMKGRTNQWLADQIGVAVSTANSYVRGAVPPADVAAKVAEALGVDFLWYVTGRRSQTAAGEGAVDVPLVDHSFAERGYVGYSLGLLRSLGVDPAAVRCMLAPGESMRPTIPEGAEVLYVPVREGGPPDGRVCVLNIGGRAAIRRVGPSASGGWTAWRDHPAFRNEPKEEVSLDDIEGEVVWVSHRP